VAIRALTFDVFGTLLDWRSGIASAFRESGLEADPDTLADDWRARLWPITGEVNHGKLPWHDFDELHHMTLSALLEERGLSLAAEARERLVQAWHRLAPWPDVRGGLEALRASHVVAALSNGHVALLVDLARHADIRFDCLLSAELPRIYKPGAEVYLTAARLLKLDPGEVMMVAAHPIDLKAARNAGLRSAFIDRPLEYGPQSPPRDDPEADISVSDLYQLAGRLR
jgi:2-haloacid dehalogenase